MVLLFFFLSCKSAEGNCSPCSKSEIWLDCGANISFVIMIEMQSHHCTVNHDTIFRMRFPPLFIRAHRRCMCSVRLSKEKEKRLPAVSYQRRKPLVSCHSFFILRILLEMSSQILLYKVDFFMYRNIANPGNKLPSCPLTFCGFYV